MTFLRFSKPNPSNCELSKWNGIPSYTKKTPHCGCHLDPSGLYPDRPCSYHVSPEPGVKGVKKRPYHFVSWTSYGYGPIICAKCGIKGENHRSLDGKCPQTMGWGHIAQGAFSNWTGKTDEEIDNGLAEFWNTQTFYRART